MLSMKEIIKRLVKDNKINQTILAEKMGKKHQSSIAELGKKEKPYMTSLIELAEAMDYDIVLKPRSGADKVERTFTINSKEGD